jgi:hypothetical protein
MTFDFRAAQLRGNKIITSGSTGTGAKLVVYDISADTASNPNQGIINPALFNTSSIGTDIFLFVSGGIGQRGTANANSIAVFGGDLVISGNLFLSGTSNITGGSGNTLWQSTTNNISFNTGSVLVTGSMTVTGNFITLGTASFGSTPIASFGSDAQTYFSGTLNKVPNGSGQRNTVFASDVIFSGSILLRSSSANPVNFILGGNSDGGLIFSGSLLSIASNGGTQIGGLSGQGAVLPITQRDANFFISGTIGGKDSSTRSITVVGGDLHVSGNFTNDGLTVVVTSYSNSFTISNSDQFIHVSTTGSVVTASLPTASRRQWLISKTTGSNVIVIASGSVSINGAAADLILPGSAIDPSPSTPQSWLIYSDGVNFFMR